MMTAFKKKKTLLPALRMDHCLFHRRRARGYALGGDRAEGTSRL